MQHLTTFREKFLADPYMCGKSDKNISKKLEDLLKVDLDENFERYFIDFSDECELNFTDEGVYTGITIKNDIAKETQSEIESQLEFMTISESDENDKTEEVHNDKVISNQLTQPKHRKRKYVQVVDKNWMPTNEYPKIDLPFTPDIFQMQSFYFLSLNKSILVTAHTSSGKTTIVDYAIMLSKLHSTKIVYTSPIKALSNQKYNEFKKYDPGIITGDISLNTDSNLLIMTTEILRNLLYSKNQILYNLEFVIFDEVHYVNNQDRVLFGRNV